MTLSVRSLAPLLVSLFLTGCGISEDRYASKSAEAWCAFYEECGYLAEYNTFDACVVDVEENLKLLLNDESCEYDPQAAKQCLRQINESSCDRELEGDVACDDVCGDGEQGAE